MKSINIQNTSLVNVSIKSKNIKPKKKYNTSIALREKLSVIESFKLKTIKGIDQEKATNNKNNAYWMN